MGQYPGKIHCSNSNSIKFGYLTTSGPEAPVMIYKIYKIYNKKNTLATKRSIQHSRKQGPSPALTSPRPVVWFTHYCVKLSMHACDALFHVISILRKLIVILGLENLVNSWSIQSTWTATPSTAVQSLPPRWLFPLRFGWQLDLREPKLFPKPLEHDLFEWWVR